MQTLDEVVAVSNIDLEVEKSSNNNRSEVIVEIKR